MRKLVVLILLFVGLGYSQIPVFFNSSKPSDRQPCVVKTFNASTDTSYTSNVIFWDDWDAPYTMFSGAATLCGGFQLISGADTITTINVRLVMRHKSELTGEGATVVYDSAGYHALTTGSGNYIPAEDAVTTTYTPFSIDLAGEDWWKPCIGIEIQFIQCSMSSGTKEVEAYLVLQRYNY